MSITLTKRQHEKSLQLFIDAFENNQENLVLSSGEYIVDDKISKREYWVSNGPESFHLHKTSKDEYCRHRIRLFWFLNKTHRKAWKYAKIIIANSKTDTDLIL